MRAPLGAKASKIIVLLRASIHELSNLEHPVAHADMRLNIPVSYTHLLTESTRQANARFFDRLDDVPRQAVSMGIGTIMQARRILLIATGEEKASAVRDMLNGAITPRMPASVLSLHRHVTVMLDNDAARLLNR